MSESATASRRQQTLHAIHSAALRLADEHGLDGFTMDDLADAVGVSRRTLFNYVPGKMDAVLGVEDVPPPALQVFLAGGPSGNVIPDLKAAVLAVLDEKDTDPDEMVRFRRLIRAEPRCLRALHDRFEVIVEEFVPVLAQREGSRIDHQQARVALRVVIALFDSALDEFVEDTSQPMSAYFARTFDTFTSLFR